MFIHTFFSNFRLFKKYFYPGGVQKRGGRQGVPSFSSSTRPSLLKSRAAFNGAKSRKARIVVIYRPLLANGWMDGFMYRVLHWNCNHRVFVCFLCDVCFKLGAKLLVIHDQLVLALGKMRLVQLITYENT